MTLPCERRNAVERMGKAAEALIPYVRRRKGQKVAHIPIELVEDAVRCLRHYPWHCHMDQAAKQCPDVFGADDETPTVIRLYAPLHGSRCRRPEQRRAENCPRKATLRVGRTV